MRTFSESRFWAKVDRKPEGCWLWTGAKIRDGYGNLRGPAGRTMLAHRFAYELLIGPIPAGRILDHLCRIRSCVNPAHLEPVSSAENTHRSPIAVAAVNGRKTTCRKGHPYDAVWREPNGQSSRRCRTCERLRGVRRRTGTFRG